MTKKHVPGPWHIAHNNDRNSLRPFTVYRDDGSGRHEVMCNKLTGAQRKFVSRAGAIEAIKKYQEEEGQ